MTVPLDSRMHFERIDIAAIKQRLVRVACPPLSAPCANFLKNMGDVDALLALPETLLVHGNILGIQGFVESIVDSIRNWLNRSSKEEGMSSRNLLFDVDRVLDDPELRQTFVEGAREQWSLLLAKDDRMKASLQTLLSASASALWTAFECVATDAWVSTLNAHPQVLTGFVNQLPVDGTDDGMDRKQISVGLLARYGFDLRNSIGDLLKPKFDFTSVSGITRAYTTAFQGSVSVQELFGNPGLVSLEATRNVIVHRAGIVDDAFKRLAKSTLPTGAALELNPDTVSAFASAVSNAGCSVLLHMSDWMGDFVDGAIPKYRVATSTE